ncbi:MAG: serine/threonine protein kinase [Leptolyngbyaceae cyanobacterium T60_A2020_046]|nr:serine/threonine protein kinase [Leptolyngbyaceae cyanobacterium T60_A2020_046]
MGGQILGDRYEVEYQLGKKSGRWTLQARDLQTQESVILKVLFLDENLRATDLKLFTREIEALKVLRHPATPCYLDYFETQLPSGDKALTLVQSFVDGRSLRSYLIEGLRLTQAQAHYLAQKVLTILASLHRQSPPIIHRDIRPSNILLNPGLPLESASIFLVDFGSVKSLTPGTTAFTVVGMDGYVSPEQASGRVLAVSDLYSLGATLVEALTGKSPSQLQTKGLRIDFEPHADLSPEFSQWLKGMLAPSLDHRWPSAEQALAALNGLP